MSNSMGIREASEKWGYSQSTISQWCKAGLISNTNNYQKGGRTIMKDKTTAIILSALLGGLGVDRFYLGYTGMGVLKLLTGGCFGVLWIIDIINIANGKLQPADGSGYSSDNIGAASIPVVNATDPYEDLKKLAQLKEQGLLTEDEYTKLKTDCMNKI